MTLPLAPLSAQSWGVTWLRDMCDKAGKECLPKNIDARSVRRVVDELCARVDAMQAAESQLASIKADVNVLNELLRRKTGMGQGEIDSEAAELQEALSTAPTPPSQKEGDT